MDIFFCVCKRPLQIEVYEEEVPVRLDQDLKMHMDGASWLEAAAVAVEIHREIMIHH